MQSHVQSTLSHFISIALTSKTSYTHHGFLESVDISSSSPLFVDYISHPTSTSVPTFPPAFQSPVHSSRLHWSPLLCKNLPQLLIQLFTFFSMHFFHPSVITLLRLYCDVFLSLVYWLCTYWGRILFIFEWSACCLILEYMKYSISICWMDEYK